jgi:hypothetical protein
MAEETDVIMERNPGQPGGEPAMTVGPRALAVIESVLARFSVLVECEHLAEGEDAFWVALQPDGLLCGFCWEAAQLLTGDAACSSCARPPGDPGRDCVVVAKPVTGLAVHFWLCETCGNADIAEAGVLR